MDSIKSEEASSPQEKSLLVPSAHQILPHRPRPQTVTTSRMQPASTPLLRAAAICFSFFLVELLAGWWCGSLAILSDAAHMFTDVIGYAVAIVAVEIGSWPATQKYTFGFARVELIGALISLFLTWNLVLELVQEAVVRLSQPHEVNAPAMLVTAIFGVCANLFMALMLQDPHGDDHDHDHHTFSLASTKDVESAALSEDLERSSVDSHRHHQVGLSNNINVQAAMIHIMGDLLGSVSILVASLTLMFRPSWTIVDPLCTLLFAVIIFGASVGLVKQYFMILMETTPDNISVETVKSHLLGTRGVVAVSSLRLWSLTSGKDACLVVVAVSRRHSSLSGRRISLGHVIASSEDVTLFAGAEEEMELMEVATLGSDSGMPSSMAHADLPGGEVEWSREEYEAVLNGIRESLLRGFGFVELFVEVHLV